MNIGYSHANSFHRRNYLTFAEWYPVDQRQREYERLLEQRKMRNKEEPPGKKPRDIYVVIGLIVGGTIGAILVAVIGFLYFGPVGFCVGFVGGAIIGGIVGALAGSLIRKRREKRMHKNHSSSP